MKQLDFLGKKYMQIMGNSVMDPQILLQTTNLAQKVRSLKNQKVHSMYINHNNNNIIQEEKIFNNSIAQLEIAKSMIKVLKVTINQCKNQERR